MTSLENDIRERYDEVNRSIRCAALRSGRDPKEIRVIAVSKGITPFVVAQAVAQGITTLGESRPQEFRHKWELLDTLDVEWHMVGPIQTNKVRLLVGAVHCIHSVDRLDVAEAISQRGEELGFITSVLVQVNVSGESTKAGVSPQEAECLIRSMVLLPGIQLQGLMTMAPHGKDPEEARPVFRALRTLSEDLRQRTGVHLPELSMGMTNDYEVAVEEGATMVRIGRRIFGERKV